MKRIGVVLYLFITSCVFGQTPQHYFHTPSNVGVNNIGFNDGVSQKFLFIYTQSEMVSMVQPVAAALDIDTIFFRSNTAANVAISNFKITIGHSTLAVPVGTFASNFNAGAPQVVLNAANYNWNCLAGTYNVPANRWSAIPITKFKYDFVNNLAVMIEFTSTSYPEPLYTNNGGAPIIQYAPVATATTATGTTGRPMFGFSMGGSAPVTHFQSSDSVFCNESGQCIDFTDLSTGNPTSWTWSFPGAIPDTSSQQNPANICYYIPGTYPVTLTVSNNSGTDSLKVSQMIVFLTSATKPVLTFSGDTIYCSHASAYQWYYNGSLITGATDSFYVATNDGVYAVQITDENGCTILSDGFNVSVIELSGAGWLTIYPNPVGNELWVMGYELWVGRQATIEIYNVLGERVYSLKSEFINRKSEINAAGLVKGVYMIEVLGSNHIYRAKFVKE